MPKVAQYQPNQVATQIAQQPLAQQAPAGAFGGDIAQGIGQLGEATLDLKKSLDTTSAEETLLLWERGKNDLLLNPETGYFASKNKKAYDNAGTTAEQLEELRIKHGENLNPEARALFDRAANNQITKAQARISQHALTEFKQWQISTDNAKIENAIENAAFSWSDFNQVNAERSRGVMALFDLFEKQGIEKDSELGIEQRQNFDTSLSTTVIESALQSSSKEAQELLDKFVNSKTIEEPDALKMRKAIETKKEEEEAEAEATEIQLAAEVLVDKAGDDREVLNDLIGGKYPGKDDDSVRKRSQLKRVAMAQFSLNKQIKQEQIAEYFDEADEIKRTDGILGLEKWKSANGKKWRALDASHRRRLESANNLETDWIKYGELIINTPRSEIENIDFTKHIDYMGTNERRAFISMVSDLRNGKPAAYTHARNSAQMINGTVDDIIGKKSRTAWTQDDRIKARELYRLIDVEIQKAENKLREKTPGALINTVQLTEILEAYEATVKKPGSLLGFIPFGEEEVKIQNLTYDDLTPELTKHASDAILQEYGKELIPSKDMILKMVKHRLTKELRQGILKDPLGVNDE